MALSEYVTSRLIEDTVDGCFAIALLKGTHEGESSVLYRHTVI